MACELPGTDTQKKALLNCISCHNLDRIVNSNHDAAEFVQVFDRMTGYYPGSTPQHPQRLSAKRAATSARRRGVKAMAEYLASVNLSRDEVWDYPLKTLPRPTGRATRVVITEYDLPRKQIQPHDAIVDADGMVWFTAFRRTVPGQARSQDRQGLRISAAGASSPAIRSARSTWRPTRPAISGSR